MKVKGNFLSQAEIEKIHELSVKVLAEQGVELEDPYAVEVFKSHGARVDGRIVYIDEAMLKSALESTPSVFEINGRNGKKVLIGEEHSVIAPVSGPLYVRRGDDIHRNTALDYKNFQKMHHNSPLMDMLNPNLIEPSDIARSVVRNYQMAVCLKYTDKPLIGLTTSPEDTVNSIEMIQRFYGTKENVTLGIINVISPLKYDLTMLTAVRLCAERRQPMMFACCSMPGATSPVSLFGTMIVNNAEVLAGIVYAQLLCPGIGCLYGNTTGSCDLRYVTPSIGSPETALFIYASAAMAQYYNIPCRTGGALSDAKAVDWQAGVESIMTMLPSMMSSSNFILHACGVMDSFSTISYEKYILDEQNIEMIRKITEGISFGDDEEEYDNIDEVGPGGQFLQTMHTLTNLRSELYTPKYFHKMSYDTWANSGAKSVCQLALDEADRRIAAYEPVALLPEQDEILRSYIGSLLDTF
ncbi:MAG: trimethylamine methyltransferase family protein [Candidatus Heteroscillospira sp.]|jgi:trimethylamine--corrinoid protein Co-methyltransferase